MAGKHAVRAAEDYIQRSLFQQAVQSMKAAKDLDPDLSCMADNYIAAYTVLEAAHAKKSLYKVLGVEDVKASGAEIKKRFRKMSLMVHPDKNGSVAAEEAFKHVWNALEVLSDDKKRLAYDGKMGYQEKSPPQQSQQQRTRRAPPHCWNPPSGFKKAKPQPAASSSQQAGTSTKIFSGEGWSFRVTRVEKNTFIKVRAGDTTVVI
uniref:J domain-containing protein n=1 Tax=Kalanchoe fedtschenkoi TaxID=63787 RepID=A0A7N0VBC9_KALFE